MILVDTSVWVDHLRRGSAQLGRLLVDGQVLCHPWVVGELALGQLHRRAEILGLLRALPHVNVASDDEVMRFVEGRRLHGTGIGWVDAHLLAAARLSGCALWSLDKRLMRAAERVGVGA